MMSSALVVGMGAFSAHGQSLGPAFGPLYSAKDLGLLPTGDSGTQIIFKPGNQNALWVGSNLGQGSAEVLQFSITRGADTHINGLVANATVAAEAHAGDNTAPLDSSMDIGPNTVLFYTGSEPFSISEIKSGASAPSKIIALEPVGFGSSLGGGGLAFVPTGLPGAGRLKIIHDATWYDTTISADGSGTYDVAAFSGTPLSLPGGSPRGIHFVAAGVSGFTKASVLIGDMAGSASAYELDANGNPILATARPFISGTDGVALAADPATGDFLVIGNDPPHIYLLQAINTAPPTVKITAPASGSVFDPGTIGFTVVADQANGVVSEVRLYSGAQLLSSVSVGASHGEVVLAGNFAVGNFAVTAKAVDGSGNIGASDPVNITVGLRKPVVTLTSPLNGSTYSGCSSVKLSANVLPGSGAITNVEFFLSGNKIGEVSAAPYVFIANDLPVGTYTVTARATDEFGTPGITTTGATLTIAQTVGQMTARLLSNNQLQICFLGLNGTNYTLESTANFQTWTTLETKQAGTGILQFLDTGVPANAQRYYRVRR